MHITIVQEISLHIQRDFTAFYPLRNEHEKAIHGLIKTRNNFSPVIYSNSFFETLLALCMHVLICNWLIYLI